MKTFTDAAGRNWTIALNLGTAKAIRDKLGVDLLQPEAGDTPLLTKLGTDELLLGEVLCGMLENQFDVHNVSEDDVRASFDGATILAAQEAFYGELVDFFHQRGRTDLEKAVAKQAEMIKKAIELADAKISAIDVEKVINEAIPGATSG